MSKYIVTVFAALLSCTPAISLAQGVGQINGNGNASQKLSTTTGVTTMHMQIVTQQGEHTFQWDSTPWRVDQGGTGQTTFTSGALLYGNGTSPIGSVAPGNLGDILQFNGTFPTWVPVSSLDISALPAGSNGQIQFNDNGALGASNNLIWDGSSLIVGGAATSTLVGDGLNSTIGGNLVLKGDTLSLVADSAYGLNAGPSGTTIFSPTASAVFSFAAQDGPAFGIIDASRLIGDTTFALPGFSGTFSLLEIDQRWTGVNTFDQGVVGTTTVNFGHMGSSTSHVCFNTKNTDGQDISFYFVGTSMVVENNACQ